MPTWYQKNSQVYTGAPNTAFNTAGVSLTAAPGFREYGTTSHVNSGLLKANLGDNGGAVGGIGLVETYSYGNAQGDQRLVIRTQQTTANDSFVAQFRQANNAYNSFIGYEINFPAGGINFYGTDFTTHGEGLIGSLHTFPAFTVGKIYEIDASIVGTVISATVKNITDNVNVNLDGGSSNTVSLNVATLSDVASTTGYAGVRQYNGGYGVALVSFSYSDTINTGPLAIAGGSSVTSSTTATIPFIVTGGSPPYAFAASVSGGTVTSGATQTGNGPFSVTVGGLSPFTHYVVTANVTDAASATLGTGANITTRPANIPTAIHILGIGDSITVGASGTASPFPYGSGRPTAIAKTMIQKMLNIPDSAASECVVAQSGASSAQVAALTSEAIAVANGGAGSGATYGGPLLAPATLVVIRLGKNDTVASSVTASNVQSIITNMTAGCPSIKCFIIEPITGYPGSGPTQDAALDRMYLTNELFRGLEDFSGPVKVIAAGRLAWWMPILDPSKVPDTVHPDDLTKSIMGIEEAMTYVNRFVFPDYKTGVNNPIDSLQSADLTAIASDLWTTPTSRTLTA